jgi:hypothetical protein
MEHKPVVKGVQCKMKILHTCLIFVFLLIGCAKTSDAPDSTDKLSAASPTLTQSNNELPTLDSRLSEIAEVFEIAIMDDIWFWGEASLYDKFLNNSVAYDIYQDDDGTIRIVTPAIRTGKEDYRSDRYCIYTLGRYNDRFTNEIPSVKFNRNANDLAQTFTSPPIGSGVMEIKEVRKPVYPAFTPRKQAVLDKIKAKLFSGLEDPSKMTALYIRDFYDTSSGTVVAYVFGNDAYYFSTVDLSSGSGSKPTRIEEEFMYYFDRLVECSFSMDLTPLDDIR